jgi:hypothetical protein
MRGIVMGFAVSISSWFFPLSYLVPLPDGLPSYLLTLPPTIKQIERDMFHGGCLIFTFSSKVSITNAKGLADPFSGIPMRSRLLAAIIRV